MATELAKAYVQIIPSAQGIQGQISSVMNGESASAGESSGKSFASSFGSIAKKALVGLGIGKIIADGIGSASEFETAMAKTSTLFSGSPEEFDALKGTILDLSSTFGMSATTLAEAAYSAESASVPMEQLGPMLESSAKLAAAGFTDIDTALSATAKTMNAYGDAAMSAEDIQKVLIQTQNLGITTVGELGASLANVTPTAAAMGVGFDQVGAAMAQMTAQGVPTAQATTQLRAAMTELGKAGTKADIAFREAAKGTKYADMGFKEAMASGANLGDVFGLMQKYADASGLSMVDLWGSVEAGNAAMMIASDVDKFNSNLQQMATDSDVVGDAYGKMANTFGTSMNRLKESATNFMTTMFNGGDISKSFDNMLAAAGDISTQLIGWISTGLKNLGANLPNLMSSALKFGESMLDALGQVDWIELGTTIINGIIGALGTLGEKITGLFSSAVTAIGNGSVDFSDIGTAMWNGITSILSTSGSWLQTLMNGALGILDSINFGSIGQTILDSVTAILTPGGENFLGGIFKDGETEISGIDWAGLGENVKQAAAGLVNLTGEVLAGAFTGANALISAIDWNALGNTVGQAANGLINLTGEALAAGFTAAESLINAIDWAGLGTTVGQAANSLVNLSGETLSAAFTSAEALIKAIDWEGLGTTVGNCANGLINLTGETLSGAFTAAHSLIGAIDWAGLGNTVGGVANKLIEYSGEALAAPFEAAFGILKGINWSEVGSAIQGGIGDVWSGLTGFLGGTLSGAGEAISGIGTGVGTAAEAAGRAFADLLNGNDAKQAAEDLKQAMASMKTALEEGKTSLTEAAKNIGANIRYSIEENLTTAQMNAIGSTMISDIEAGTTETEGSLDTKMTSIGTNAAARITAVGWRGVGFNIVTGIISGINAATSLLTARMTQLATSALTAAKTALKIGSPSRIMEEGIGRWIPAGIALGIAQNSSLVDDAMNDLAASVAADNISGTLIAQGRGMSAAAGSEPAGSEDGGLISRIVEAVREGMQNADISLYMDSQKVGQRVNEYLGDEIAVRSFA